MPRHSIKIACVCEACGKTFFKPHCRVREGRGKHCSRQCYNNDRTTPLAERFVRHLSDPTDSGCVLWTGKRHDAGYGLIRAGGPDLRELFTHRISYAIAFGDFDESLWVLHQCDNPPCVNPAHLFLGTNLDNIADAVAKGRNARGERVHASKLTETQVLQIRQEYADGGVFQRELGDKFGITQSSVGDIIRRTSWKHVDHPAMPIGAPSPPISAISNSGGNPPAAPGCPPPIAPDVA